MSPFVLALIFYNFENSDCVMSNLIPDSNTISEIAASLGFDDVLTFSKLFSKKVGISPTNYRKG